MKTITFFIPDMNCDGDDKLLEQKLKVKRHIVEVKADLVKRILTITYHEKFTNVATLRKLIEDCDFHCEPLPLISSKDAFEIFEHKNQVAEEEKRI